VLSAGLTNNRIDRAVAVFDYGWTEEQAWGLLDSLNLTGGEPNWKPICRGLAFAPQQRKQPSSMSLRITEALRRS
jgi:hypothetical protein